MSCCRVLPNSVLVVPPQPDSPRPSRLSRPANRNGPERASACGLLPAAGPPAPPRQPGQVSSFFTSWQTARHPADPRPTRPSGLVPAIPFVTLAYLTGVFKNFLQGGKFSGMAEVQGGHFPPKPGIVLGLGQADGNYFKEFKNLAPLFSPRGRPLHRLEACATVAPIYLIEFTSYFPLPEHILGASFRRPGGETPPLRGERGRLRGGYEWSCRGALVCGPLGNGGQ